MFPYTNYKGNDIDYDNQSFYGYNFITYEGIFHLLIDSISKKTRHSTSNTPSKIIFESILNEK
tara:strand:+ start:336 stop:524 length:189 start_codon:yes stop_codon:yes gene_type:complete